MSFSDLIRKSIVAMFIRQANTIFSRKDAKVQRKTNPVNLVNPV